MSSGAHSGRDHLTWVGHGTVVVAMGGTRVIVDPVLRPRVLHLKRFDFDFETLAQVKVSGRHRGSRCFGIGNLQL